MKSIHRMSHKDDSGALSVQAMVSIFVGFILVAAASVIIMVNVNKTKEVNDLQAANSSISRALDEVDNSVDTSDKAVYASPTELVLQKNNGGSAMMTRWVISEGSFYRQQWDGAPTDYNHSGAWIPVTKAKAAAPSGVGTQYTSKVATNLDSSKTRLDYYKSDGTKLSVATADVSSLSGIAQVATRLEGTVTAEGRGSLVNTKVSVIGGQKLPAGVVIADPEDIVEPTPAPSASPVPSGTPGPKPSASATPTPSPTATSTPTPTAPVKPTPTPTATPKPTPTATPKPTPTATPKPVLACATPTVTLSGGKIVLKWNAVKDATSYKITRDGNTIATVTGLTYTDATNVTVNHSYKVLPASAKATSPVNCAAVNFTPAKPTTPTTPLIACTVPKATMVNGKIVVSWTAVKGATSYQVKRNGVAVGTTKSGVLNFTDTTASATKSYKYQVIPSGTGYRTPASCAEITYTPKTLACPASPVAKNVGGKIVITWSKVSGAQEYKILRGSSQVGSTTTLKFTDSKASATSQYSYRVIPVTPGMISPNCATFNYVPPLQTPKFYNSQVGVTGEWPTSWTGSSSSPDITVNWKAVPRATSYKLEYRIMDYTGTKTIKNWSLAAETKGLTYQMPKSSFNEMYQWRVTAFAGAEKAVSSTIDMLTHPVAAKSLATKAQYINVDTGKNVVSWAKVPGAAGYHIYTVSNGAHKRLTTVTSGSTTSYTHQNVAYGSTIEYWVAPYNNGPRGVDANSKVVTGKRSAPAPGKSTVQRTTTKKQLQFPATPSAKGVNASNLTAGSQDLNLKNVIRWNAVPTATKYQVDRQNHNGSDFRCLTSSNCDGIASSQGSGTSFTDSSVKAGAQYRYSVVAINATGLSYTVSNEVRLTQRPAKPSVKSLKSPTLSSTAYQYQVSNNADAGTPGFCTSSTCSLISSEKVSKATSAPVSTITLKDNGASTQTISRSAGWGDTIAASVVAKNIATYNGGKSDAATVTYKEYPGSFSLTAKRGDSDGDNTSRVYLVQPLFGGGPQGGLPADPDSLKTRKTSTTQEHYQEGKLFAQWGSSSGVKSNGYEVSYSSSGASTSSNSDLMLPKSSEKTGKTTLNSAGQWTLRDVSPGAKYTMKVKVTARSGLTRTAEKVVYTNMDLPRQMTFNYLCSGTAPRGASAPNPKKDYTQQKVVMKASSSNVEPRYGKNGKVSIQGYFKLNTGSTNYGSWKDSSSSITTYSNTAGVGYKYYYRHGFNMKTLASGDNPGSYTVEFGMGHLSPFQSDCAKRGETNPSKMKEPSDVCYGYTGKGDCYRKNAPPYMKTK